MQGQCFPLKDHIYERSFVDPKQNIKWKLVNKNVFQTLKWKLTNRKQEYEDPRLEVKPDIISFKRLT